MAILNFIDFLTRDTGEAAASSGTIALVEVDSAFVLQANPTTTGNARYRMGIHGADAFKTNHDLATAYYTFEIRFTTLPASASEEFVVCLATNQGLKLALRITSAGKIQAYQTNGTTQLGSDGATTLTTGTWYRIAITCGTGASAAYSISLNGTVELSGTGNLNTLNNGFLGLGKYNDRNNQSVDYYYRRAVIDDAAYVTGSFAILRPNVNGSTQQWTNGTNGSDWQELDGLVPVTSEYVRSTAANQVALFGVTDTGTAGITGTVQAVKQVIYEREDTGGASEIALRVRSGSTNSDSTTVDAGSTSTATLARVLLVDPNTSSAWTLSAVDSVEIGAVEGSGSAVRLRMSWAALMVLYTPATAKAPPLRFRPVRVWRRSA